MIPIYLAPFIFKHEVAISMLGNSIQGLPLFKGCPRNSAKGVYPKLQTLEIANPGDDELLLGSFLEFCRRLVLLEPDMS